MRRYQAHWNFIIARAETFRMQNEHAVFRMSRSNRPPVCIPAIDDEVRAGSTGDLSLNSLSPRLRRHFRECDRDRVYALDNRTKMVHSEVNMTSGTVRNHSQGQSLPLFGAAFRFPIPLKNISKSNNPSLFMLSSP